MVSKWTGKKIMEEKEISTLKPDLLILGDDDLKGRLLRPEQGCGYSGVHHKVGTYFTLTQGQALLESN